MILLWNQCDHQGVMIAIIAAAPLHCWPLVLGLIRVSPVQMIDHSTLDLSCLCYKLLKAIAYQPSCDVVGCTGSVAQIKVTRDQCGALSLDECPDTL